MTYTFTITTASSVVYEVFPLNWLECALVDELEGDNVFYRRKFQGELTFGGKKLCDDFNLFWAIEQSDPCEVIYLTIYQDSDIYWEGKFSTSDGKWDLDASTFSVTPLPVDDYSEWIEETDVEYNILQAGLDFVTTTAYQSPDYDEEYDRNLWLMDVIEYIVQQTVDASLSWASGTIISEFFDDDPNYVTGGTNRYTLVTIAQKSDIKRPDATNPATVGMMSFDDLMEILKIWNLRWDYRREDVVFMPTMVFRIEHLSWWTSPEGIDIRTQEMAIKSNKYRYLKETMPKYEKFAMMEAKNLAFVGKPIWYDSACINPDINNNSTDFSVNITTDIEYILDCMDALAGGDDTQISDSGWVIFANEDRAGTYYILSGYSILDVGVLLNYYMSWECLHNYFWRHGRQVESGYLNGQYVAAFYSSRKIKEQQVNIIKCTEFDPDEYITTELGETYFNGEKGYVSKAVIKPYGEINLTLVYGPEAEEITPIPDVKGILIREAQTPGLNQSTLTATLTDPADPGDTQVQIRFRMLDSPTAEQCWTAWATITVVAGSYTGSTTVNWCEVPDPPGGTGDYADCIMTYETIDPAGWTVTVEMENECT